MKDVETITRGFEVFLAKFIELSRRPKIDLQDRVLITDPHVFYTQAVVGSLERKNVATTLATQNLLSPSLFSRWRPGRVYCSAPVDNLEVFIANLFRIVRGGKYLTVFPMSETSLLPISENRNQLASHLKLVLPSHESVEIACDKSRTLELAENLGIPTPVTFRASNLTEVQAISSKIQYPAVIKPRYSFVWGKNGKANFSRPSYVNSPSELVSVYTKVNEIFPAPLIQEYVSGYNISVPLLFDRGKPIAACSIKEHRTMPLTGGISVLRESVPLNPMLLKYASSLLKGLLWHGVADVEFRVNSKDLTPKLMEINARFWGSMKVAIESGVDFPYLMFLLAKGERLDPIFTYKIGVKCRWLIGDTQNLFSTFIDGQSFPKN